MRKRFRLFGTDNNVVRPVVAENFIKKEFERAARDSDTTVANSGLNTIMKIVSKFVGCDLGCRLVSVLLKKSYMTEIMILGMLSIPSKFHFEDHLLKIRGKSLGVLRHKKSSFLQYKLLAERMIS